MTQDDIIRMAREANILEPVDLLESNQWRQDTIRELERFAALVVAAKEREMQARVVTLHAMYEQACQHRDQLMDERSAAIAAMRGKIQ